MAEEGPPFRPHHWGVGCAAEGKAIGEKARSNIRGSCRRWELGVEAVALGFFAMPVVEISPIPRGNRLVLI